MTNLRDLTASGEPIVAYIDNDNISIHLIADDGEVAMEPSLSMHPYDYMRESMELLGIRAESV